MVQIETFIKFKINRKLNKAAIISNKDVIRYEQ